jgi:hypothetical protein
MQIGKKLMNKIMPANSIRAKSQKAIDFCGEDGVIRSGIPL